MAMSQWPKARTAVPATQRARGVLRDFGLTVSEDVAVRVWDSTAEIRYLVLPERPAGTEGLSIEALEALVTRDTMIGTAKVVVP